jgi:hypothetical protein
MWFDDHIRKLAHALLIVKQSNKKIIKFNQNYNYFIKNFN